MSGYRIVLNLTGNASKKVSKLASDLIRADVAATSLSRSLGRVSIASRGIRNIRTVGATGVRTPVGGQPHYTRHRSTRIASFGTGMNIGGFSGRFSTILQPDARGNILGMNASNLMKGANVAAIASSLLASVGKVALKTIAATTIAPIAIGGGVMAGALRYLQSESFAGGVRLISRRSQAKIGLGADFERAQSSADFLSGAYGFDRSTTLSSINVLSGMGVGGTDRKLTTSEATGLTKVGGLISQQSGVPFERVMTNIQQLLVQTTPHVRDIREMLNQAPILGKYALKDMEEQGVKGVDVRTWMKDQSNIMSAMKRYELDLATNAGMQARGRIGLAQQDAAAKIAGNDPFWSYVGIAGSSLIGSMGGAADSIMTNLADNDPFKVMVAHIETIFDKIGEDGGSLITKLTAFIDAAAQRLGLDVGDKAAARIKVGRSNTVEALISEGGFMGDAIKVASDAGLFNDYKAGSEGETLAVEKFKRDIGHALKTDETFFEGISGSDKFRRKTSLVDNWVGGIGWEANLLASAVSNYGIEKHNTNAAFNTVGNATADSVFQYLTPDVNKAFFDRNGNYGGRNVTPTNEYASYEANTNEAMKVVTDFVAEQLKAGTFDPKNFSGGGGEAQGSALSGYNRDRRALEIHFNAPIVEWSNTMETSSPQETVDAVAENIEEIAAAAIQKALLGASNKMSSRWY